MHCSLTLPCPIEGLDTVIAHTFGYEQLRDAYNAVDVFAHSAHQGESFGYVLAEAALCEVPIVTMATLWADNSRGRGSGPSYSVAITLRGFASAIEQRAAEEDLPKHVSHLRAGREHILESFVSNPVVDNMLGIPFGEEAPVDNRTGRSDVAELQGSSLMRFVARNLSSQIGSSTSGQKSRRWFLTGKLNARGI